MAPPKTSKAVAAGRAALLFSTLVSFIVCQLLEVRISNPATSPFNITFGNISGKYITGITPSDATFKILGLIYTWQGIAILYLCTQLFRKSSGQQLYVACQSVTNLFCLCYSANLLSNSLWSVVYLADDQYGAELLLVSSFLLLLVAIISVVYSLDSAGQDMMKRGLNTDIWLTRLLVQNGTAIYLGWISCSAIISGVVVLHYERGLSMDTACWIGLGILNTLVVIWFALETFVFDRQLRYIFAHYIAYVAALSGIYIADYDAKYTWYSNLLLVLVAVLGLTKVSIMILRGFHDPIKYNKRNSSGERQRLI